jgi:alpha-L-rhamnosidase
VDTAAETGGGSVSVRSVRFEHHREPIGIGEPEPRISWMLDLQNATGIDGADSSAGASAQVAYEIRITDLNSTDVDVAEDGEGWLSGRIESAESVLVPWPAEPLPSRASRSVSVRVWVNGADAPSSWSDEAVLETGLLDGSDWTAELVTGDWIEDTSTENPPALFRKEFESDGEIASARLYVTAHGVYEVEINGVTVGEDVLAPGWSSYNHRLRYQTHDVTDLVSSGANAIGATVADGWFRGHLGFEGGKRNIYGDHVGLLAQLEIRYRDGSTQTVVTDTSWKAGRGPALTAGIYAGERYDARLELNGWTKPGFDDSAWVGVKQVPLEYSVLVAPPGPAVRRIEEVAPIEIFTSFSGRTLVDFGQNLVGRLKIRVSGNAGDVVTLRHAEVLEDQELGTRPLRFAEATDSYTLKGGGTEEWEPLFTFHGFRYVEIDGWPGELSADDIRAVVLHTDMERTGWFTCSNELINKLHENVVWGMRGNFLDVPTDCPQRDERLGWTGDIQVFTPTARYLFDCTGMLASWLEDVSAEQQVLGTVPVYVPFIQLLFPPAPVAAWGDAAVVVPWVLYERTGDAELLRRQYPSMKAWVDQVAEIAGEDHIWNSGLQLGDWLDPTAPPDQPAAARTDKFLVATAYHALTARLLSQAAQVLGLTADASTYAELANEIRAAFLREFVSPSGRLVSDAPTAFALGIRFGLLDDSQLARAGERLVDLLRADKHHIGTGFVGTPIISDALSDVGAYDTAYHLLNQQECPSWLYPVTMGATTIWERWDSMLPDGSINPGEMTSFNHYALGAVADWLHRTVAGLAPAEPGYRRLTIAPRPGGGLSSASTAHESPYGRAEAGWTRDGDQLTVNVLVPPGVTADVHLPEPGWEPQTVGAGRHQFTCSFRAVAEDPPIPIYGMFGQQIN